MEGTIGEIRMFAGNFAPRTWAFCTGTVMSIQSNVALFSVIGNAFGGDGKTTFAIPNLSGRVAVGIGTGPGLSAITIAQQLGEAAHTLIQTEMPMHTHQAFATGAPNVMASTDNATISSPTAGVSIAVPGSGSPFVPSLGFNTSTPDVQLNPASANKGSIAVTNGNAGGNQPHNNMQPYLAMNYVICLQGIFPSRN